MLQYNLNIVHMAWVSDCTYGYWSMLGVAPFVIGRSVGWLVGGWAWRFCENCTRTARGPRPIMRHWFICSLSMQAFSTRLGYGLIHPKICESVYLTHDFKHRRQEIDTDVKLYIHKSTTNRFDKTQSRRGKLGDDCIIGCTEISSQCLWVI